MLVLGLESSCDETAAALVADGERVLADVISSQASLHERYGGVVPELASRHHLINLIPVLEELFSRSGCRLDEVEAVAVTRGPGLVGALLVALQAGKALAYARGLPLVGVNHLEGHLTAVFLRDADEPPHPVPRHPHLALLVSGGHTALVRVEAFGRFGLLGGTIDDAAGEAFDKVAKLLGLGYPGGAVIDRLARGGDPRRWRFPRALAGKGVRDFSFSGLKTAVLVHVQRHGLPTGAALADLCASFQQAVVDVLVERSVATARAEGLTEIVLSGGVAANSRLRAELAAAGSAAGLGVFVPPPRRCTDNGAMIAAAGEHRLRRGERAGLDLNAQASLALSR